MNNRLCPTEKILSEYISACLCPQDKIDVEKHLADCAICRKLLVETHDMVKKIDFFNASYKLSRWIWTKCWFIGTLIAFLCSFFFPKYFLQFLTICLLMGAKCVIDSKNTKMLITIYEAWKNTGKKPQDKIFTKSDN